MSFGSEVRLVSMVERHVQTLTAEQLDTFAAVVDWLGARERSLLKPICDEAKRRVFSQGK